MDLHTGVKNQLLTMHWPLSNGQQQWNDITLQDPTSKEGPEYPYKYCSSMAYMIFLLESQHSKYTRAHRAHTPCACTLQTQYRGTKVAVEDDCNCSAERSRNNTKPTRIKMKHRLYYK